MQLSHMQSKTRRSHNISKTGQMHKGYRLLTVFTAAQTDPRSSILPTRRGRLWNFKSKAIYQYMLLEYCFERALAREVSIVVTKVSIKATIGSTTLHKCTAFRYMRQVLKEEKCKSLTILG